MKLPSQILKIDLFDLIEHIADAPDTPGLVILKRFDQKEKVESPEEVKVAENKDNKTENTVELDWHS